MDTAFYKGKKVFITGHTGFKGAWMCMVLLLAGAEVTGYALPAEEKSLFRLCGLDSKMNSVEGDIRDLESLQKAIDKAQPEIVIHMAAQPIVKESYVRPVYTYETNVMGTVNILEAVRNCPSVKSFVNVTTDKVYRNREWEWGYRENEELNGFDPYSNSKSCSELVTDCYCNSFFADRDIAVSACRAGNVIGGGDFAKFRIIPDCVEAAHKGEDIIVRNPASVRPFQHVLEPVTTYLTIAEKQYNDRSLAGRYNIGPDECDCLTAGALVDLFCEKWNKVNASSVSWKNISDNGPHEAGLLKLDCSKVKSVFGWRPTWHIDRAIEMIVDWCGCYFGGGDINDCMNRQISTFLSEQQR
ncbi:MAG: CDP-glucose 4,6-dehydratase [Ruminococcus sp.]|nr:CDP-glucose 4,6-dehydratase [Ruminococcus sp.]